LDDEGRHPAGLGDRAETGVQMLTKSNGFLHPWSFTHGVHDDTLFAV